MKKTTLIVLLLFLSVYLRGQNIQLHYDFGEDRKHVTTTLEMFHPDQWGSTFWFVDFDYNDGGSERKSASMAYWEISRMINLKWVKGLSAGLQYNDGLSQAGSFGNVWLTGTEYLFNIPNATLSASFWLRLAENQDPDVQITIVWYKSLFNEKAVFTGFVDIWGQRNTDFDNDGTDHQYVILTEPQIWYNVTENFAVGTEVEVSRNFIFGKGNAIKVNPTLGIKWIF